MQKLLARRSIAAPCSTCNHHLSSNASTISSSLADDLDDAHHQQHHPSAASAFNIQGHHDGRNSPPPESESASLIDYLALYRSASAKLRPLVLAGMLLWLTFLFAFVGITAADFFCPNLSTIATRLGMSESVAGCTLLAFSNGSPDVFSTFSALQAHSGSLAIGELIGAASFITMVVSGTMCLIHPFRVPSHTFLRDVGFFALAVACTLVILWDGHIHAWEALAMVLLYVAYVLFVAGGTWYIARRDRRREIMRQARSEYAVDPAAAAATTEYRDDPLISPESIWQHQPRPNKTRSTSSSSSSSSLENYLTDFRFPFPAVTPTTHPHQHEALTDATLLTLNESNTPVTLTRTRSGSSAARSPLLHRRPHSKSTVRPSLLGAIEFRDVVNALRADSTARTLAVFGVDEAHTHAGGNGAARAMDEEGIDQRSRRGPHMHGRSTSMSSAAAGTAGGRMQFNTLLSDGAATMPSVWNERRSGAVLPSSSPGIDAATASTDEGAAAEEDEEEGEEGRRRRWEGDAIASAHSPLVDLGDEVHDPWRGVNRDGQGSSAASIGRRDRSSSNRSSLARLSIPSSPTSTSRKPRATSTTMLDANGKTIRRRPSILLTSAGGAESTVLGPATSPDSPYSYSFAPAHALHISRAVVLALFPSLHDWRSKSLLGKGTAVLCVPAILVLNLTLPVVECENEDCDEIEEKERLLLRRDQLSKAGYRDLEEGEIEADEEEEEEQEDGETIRSLGGSESFARSHRPFVASADRVALIPSETEELQYDDEGTRREDEGRADSVDEEVDREILTRWLTAVQCTLAPVFCVCALFGSDTELWYALVAFAVGGVLASLAFFTFKRHTHPGRIVLCFVGFFVAMVWILTIVNEVVGVLQAIAVVFGLSDAIIGLTVFAIGNSVGDWVANATVARMGFPNMAIAACFGGPMLNILLGLGLSGSYMIYKSGGEPYHVEVGKTLLVSGVSLLIVLIATLILVPMNGYWMNRKLGGALIGAYCIVLALNIATEVWK